MKSFIHLLLILLVCRIFVVEENTSKDITKWLINKKIVSVTQSSGGVGGLGGVNTYITIIAEVIE